MFISFIHDKVGVNIIFSPWVKGLCRDMCNSSQLSEDVSVKTLHEKLVSNYSFNVRKIQDCIGLWCSSLLTALA